MKFEGIKEKRVVLSAFILLFVGLFLYFTYAHPLMIFDTDDWHYVGEPRHAIPGFGRGVWNPIKVLPEMIQCFVSEIGVCFLMPFTHDFFMATSLAYAVFSSIVIAGFFYLLLRLLDRKFGLNGFQKLAVLGLIVILYFLTFVSADIGNENLFSEGNLTCFFNYTIPAVANMSLVLYFMTDGIPDLLDNSVRVEKRAVILLVCYLCICSNLCENFYLAAYLGETVLLDVLQKRGSISNMVKRNRTALILYLGWVLSCILELSGGRAGSVGHVDMKVSLGQSVECFFDLLTKVNVWEGLCLAILVLAFAVVFFCVKDNSDSKKVFLSFAGFNAFYALILWICTIVLAARVAAGNAGRPSVVFGFFTAVFLILAAMLWFVSENSREVNLVIPIIMLFLLNELITGKALFKEYNVMQISPELCREIGNDIIDQIIEADKSGEEEADIYIMKSTKGDNWPNAIGGFPMLMTTLRHYKIIKRDFEVNPIPSEEINEKYHLTFEEL